MCGCNPVARVKIPVNNVYYVVLGKAWIFFCILQPTICNRYRRVMRGRVQLLTDATISAVSTVS